MESAVTEDEDDDDKDVMMYVMPSDKACSWKNTKSSQFFKISVM